MKDIIFDFDGTLIDSRECIYGIYRKLFAELGIDEPEESEMKKFIGPPVEYAMEKYLDEPARSKACARFREMYRDVNLKEANKLYDGAEEMLRVLKESGKRLFIATTKNEEMAKKIAAEPDKKYWDFSLNDNYNYCTCESCARVLEETGSMMGTMLPIINSLAEKFPDKVISTLAYFYNEEVPKGMVCEENVNIVLCPINTGQLYSYRFGASEKAAKTKQLVESWSAVCQSLMIWDYVVDFQHLLLPYPNFDVQKDNHAFYIENNVKEIFHQGSREKNDEMARLRTYVLSKQLWDNELDVSALIAKYLTVTYGDAAPYIAEYMDGMNARLKEKGEDLDLYDEAWQHAGDYLSKADNDRYLELVNSALAAVEGDERLTYYVEEIKINVLYAIMNEATNLYHFRKKDAFSEFTALVQKHDIEQPHEVGVTMQEYIDTEYPAFLTENALKITACVVSAVAAAGIAAGIAVILKKKKAKKQQG